MLDRIVYFPVKVKKPPPPIDWKNPYTVPYGAHRPSLIAVPAPRLTFGTRPNGSKVLGPLNPNVGLRCWYRKRMQRMIDKMHASIMKWVLAGYRANEPHIVEMAQDAMPSELLRKLIKQLTDRWQKQFDTGAEELAAYFATAANKRTDAALQAILKRAGFSVDFKMTKAQRDVIEAAVNENVSLIKSIPQEYLKNVEGDVMRSVQAGGAAGDLAKKLNRNYGVAMRRAKFIARDQNAKATSVLGRARYLELGIEKALWRHSSAGKVPRKSHLANDGKEYDVAKGWWDPDEREWIHPGQLINCRCSSKPIIKGFI